MTTAVRGAHTPWGPSQQTTHIADGITLHSTAGHGGYHVAPSRLRQMPSLLAAIVPFNNNTGWYEEDEDWAIVPLAFPDAFEIESLDAAVRTAQNPHNRWSPRAEQFFRTPPGQKVLALVQAWRAEHAEEWYGAGGGSSREKEGGWRAYYTRVKDGQRLTVEWPTFDSEPVGYTLRMDQIPAGCIRLEQKAPTPPPVDPIQARAAIAEADQQRDYGGAFDGNQVTSDADPGL